MHVAIIPARKGSKSIINKNLVKLGKLGLAEHAIEFAKKAKIFDRIILTTDIETLQLQYREDKKVIVHERPEALASDQSLMLDVVTDLLNYYKIKGNDWIWLLQPTSPFRCPGDLRDLSAFLYELEINSVISVCDVGANHPNRTYTVKNGQLYPLRFTNFTNKQGLMDVYIRNGCYYIFKADEFLKEKTFYLKPCHAYVMGQKASINIDCELDLHLARAIYNEKKKV